MEILEKIFNLIIQLCKVSLVVAGTIWALIFIVKHWGIHLW